MGNVCVITGGGSGMGLAAAEFMPKSKTILISGRTASRLENAVRELSALGFDAHFKTCDTSSRESVRELADYAASLGRVTNVINAAGLSPAMADPEKLLRVNALGTVYVNQEFRSAMSKGSVIVDIASNSAYALPRIIIPEKAYRLADVNEKEFLRRVIRLSSLPRDSYKRSGLAYAISKNFVIWYAKKCALEYGSEGIRVASLSPGLVSTDMGNLEAAEGSEMLRTAAVKRMGTPKELGFAIASLADERNGYLAGTDILCDGGSRCGMVFAKG